MDKQLEDYCYKVNLDHEYKLKLNPFVLPRLKQAIAFIGLSLRYVYSIFEVLTHKIEQIII